MAAKIARNVIVYESWMAGLEGARLAKAAGLDVRKLVEAVEASAGSVAGPMLWFSRASRLDEDPQERALRQATAGLLEKDLDAALALAEGLEVALPLARIRRGAAAALVGLEDDRGSHHG